jgi:hypothetical protein
MTGPRATLRIINNTYGSLTASVAGATADSWPVADGQTLDRSLPVGSYQLTVQAGCGSKTDAVTLTAGSVETHTYSCVVY